MVLFNDKSLFSPFLVKSDHFTLISILKLFPRSNGSISYFTYPLESPTITQVPPVVPLKMRFPPFWDIMDVTLDVYIWVSPGSSYVA